MIRRMRRNTTAPPWRRAGRTALPLCALAPGVGPRPVLAQEGCPNRSGPDAEAGWEAYVGGDMATAEARFRAALALCAEDGYARTGLGYVALRADDLDQAEALWTAVVAADPDNIDAWNGLGLAAWRRGSLDQAEEAFERVVALDAEHATALDYLERIRGPQLGPPPARPALQRPDTVELRSRVAGERFEVLEGGVWRPFYLKGVNLGAALPGRFPSQFPEADVYATWIERMADMQANVVRVYTVHPPAFYEALADWNRAHPDRVLWLVHGVWTEIPPGDDFKGEPYESDFFTEIRTVVDVVHGRASVAYRPGHAWGHYTADVAPWTLAYILGREWEPHSVLAFDSIQGGASGFDGAYVQVTGGNAMDAWMGESVEEIVRYETETYGTQRPVAYTNWPTLDPLDHPSETTVDQEMEIRRAFGETPGVRPREYENDAIGLDATLMRATPRFAAGLFASFHAYPYYPDFMILSEQYRDARSTMGPSRYFGYLQDLARHHRGMPVVISEYGLPASLGNAHLQPDGWHHGGLTEEQMAEGNRRLTLEIAEAGLAGGILFAWIDEWFKQNWVALEFELPQDRNRLWYNRLDAEQHYGMWAVEARPPIAGETLEQRRAAWGGVAPLYDAPGLRLKAASDEAYLWLLVETPEIQAADTVLVGFDMIREDAGDFHWPGRVGERLPVGIEFALRATHDEVRVMADPPSNPFRHVEVGVGATGLTGDRVPFDNPPPGLFHARVEQMFNLPYYTVPNEDGVFDSLRVVVNRRRFASDGTEFLAAGYDRGLLPGGSAPDGFWERTSDGTTLEVRIPWLLLNVTDPSSHQVLQGPGADNVREAEVGPDGRWRLRPGVQAWPDSVFGSFGTETVDGIGIVAALRSGMGAQVDGPAQGGAVARFRWEGWEEPEWTERPRATYHMLADVFSELHPYGMGGPVVPPPRSPVTQADTLAGRAAEAWVQGETEQAMALYEAVLRDAPDDAVALHRTALMLAWNERYAEALTRLDRLLGADPANHDARVDRARVLAWSGDTRAALEELDRVLTEVPDHAGALEARGQFEAWAGRYEASLDSYARLLAIAPEHEEARRQRAQVLAWAADFGASVAAYDAILVEDPDDLEARLGRARALAFSDRLTESVEEYERVLARAPGHPAATVGLGRTLGWAGRLVEGERVLRRGAAEQGSADAWFALGQNLSWQGRPAAALEAAEAAVAADPTHADAREQLRGLRAGLRTTVAPFVSFESDSDGNRMRTSGLAGTWFVTPRLRVRADASGKSLEQGPLRTDAFGVAVSAAYQFEPGWTFSAGAGGSRVGDGPAGVSVRAGLESPARHAGRFSLAGETRVLDGTAALAGAGVRMLELGVDGRWRPAPRWWMEGGVGYARFEGSARNLRRSARLTFGRSLGPFDVGVAGRTFAFDEDLDDGYFDPAFYGIAEATLAWRARFGKWGVLVEGAPGVQRIGEDGDVTGTTRGSLRVSYDVAAGREVALSAGRSNTGLQSFASGASDYRYEAVVLSVGWRF